VSTMFINPPVLQISLPELQCFQSSDIIGLNSSCRNAIAAPAVTTYNASVLSWGGSDPGTLEVTDNCGGSIGVLGRGTSDVAGLYLPPAAGGVCLITARAVSRDGLTTTQTLAVLARPGTDPPAQPPSVFAEYETGCVFGSPGFPTNCGSSFVGNTRTVFFVVNLSDGHPGTLTLVDDCAGAQLVPSYPVGGFFGVSWVTPSPGGGRTCTTTFRATTLEGGVTEAVATYQLFGP
jgi:hypothetical protein